MDAREYIKKLVSDGTSQTAIARKCLLSNGTITKILYSESKLTLDTIKKIALAYELPLSYFLEDPNQPGTGYIAPTNDPEYDALARRMVDASKKEPTAKTDAYYQLIDIAGNNTQLLKAFVSVMEMTPDEITSKLGIEKK